MCKSFDSLQKPVLFPCVLAVDICRKGIQLVLNIDVAVAAGIDIALAFAAVDHSHNAGQHGKNTHSDWCGNRQTDEGGSASRLVGECGEGVCRLLV